jgi:hypothetical protein
LELFYGYAKNSTEPIVIFLRTRKLPQGGSIYHGFITTYKDLTQRKRSDLIDLLVDEGFVKRNGKIL